MNALSLVRTCVIAIAASCLLPTTTRAQLPHIIDALEVTTRNGIVHQGTVPATGKVVTFGNGAILESCDHVNGRRHGDYASFHTGTVINVKATYAEGQLHGPYSEHYPNGTLRLRSNYENGKRSGTEEAWHLNGQKRSSYAYISGDFVDGLYKEYDENGQMVLEKTIRSGVAVLESTYAAGVLTGRTEYYPNGKHKRTGSFANGKEHGVFVDRDTEGRITHKTEYENGLRNGQVHRYLPNGKVDRVQYFNNDTLLRYEEIGYYPNGGVHNKMSYDAKGNKTGEAQHLWSDGSIKRKSIYQNGVEVEVLVDNPDDPELWISRTVNPELEHVLFAPMHPATDDPIIIMTLHTAKGSPPEIGRAVRDALKSGRLAPYMGSRDLQADYRLTVRDIDLKVVYDDGVNVTEGKLGTITTRTNPGYRAWITMSIELLDTRLNRAARTPYKWGTLIQPDQQTAKSAALTATGWQRDLEEYLVLWLPMQGTITQLFEPSPTSVRKVLIDIGPERDLAEKQWFVVHTTDAAGNPGEAIGKLKVTDIEGAGRTICKVMEGGERILQAFGTQPLIVITTTE